MFLNRQSLAPVGGIADSTFLYYMKLYSAVLTDLDRGIVSIRYNVLNLPDIIQFKNGNQMINTYNANGQKLRTKYYTALNPVIVPVNTIHSGYSTSEATLRLDDYFGSVLYENGTAEDAAHHPLTKVLTPEGYIDYATAGKPYCYNRVDHLGSIREVDSYLGNNRTVVQKTQYYPSGTAFMESYGSGVQPYKFTGKELITMHGLNWQDYGARWLDNVRMQFTSVDPLAEKYYSISPYAYCAGNPVRFIDSTGMSMDDYQLKDDGRIDLIKKTDDDHDVLYATDKNGNADKNTSITLNKDILSSKVTEQIKTINGPETIDYYTSFDNNQSTAFFNFVSDNSNAEWANSKFSVDGQVGYENVSFISTSGGDGSSGSVSYLFDKYLSKFNYKGFDHSHTNNTEQVSPGDINVATDISKKFPDAKFNIYIPLTGALIPYNKNSTSGLLHEATVIGKAPHKINK
jgi:RHS repeat-associated protein